MNPEWWAMVGMAAFVGFYVFLFLGFMYGAYLDDKAGAFD